MARRARPAATCRQAAARPQTQAERALTVLMAVADLIPAPGLALAVDEESWQAFDELLLEAADRVISALGPAGGAAAHTLSEQGWAYGPVHQALATRVIDRLRTGDHHRYH